MIFTLERVRTRDGEVKERELRRKGQRVQIPEVTINRPLVFAYVDEGSVCVSSIVEAYNPDWKTGNQLVVQTVNSVYTFKKEATN